MKLTKSTIAATFAALLIGGLAISPASAKVYYETGRVDVSDHVGFEVEGKGTYNTGRVAPEGNATAVLHSDTVRTNGRTG